MVVLLQSYSRKLGEAWNFQRGAAAGGEREATGAGESVLTFCTPQLLDYYQRRHIIVPITAIADVRSPLPGFTKSYSAKGFSYAIYHDPRVLPGRSVSIRRVNAANAIYYCELIMVSKAFSKQTKAIRTHNFYYC